MSITEQDILHEIKKLALFPHGKVCKHYIMLNLMGMMEQQGISLNLELVKAISDADDSKILDLIPQTVVSQT